MKAQEVAEAVAQALGSVSGYEDVRADSAGRVTLLFDGRVVTLVVAMVAESVDVSACPFCGSTRPLYVEDRASFGTTRFVPRRGCTDCNRWLDPTRIDRSEP